MKRGFERRIQGSFGTKVRSYLREATGVSQQREMIMLGRIKLRRAALGGLAALTLGFIAFDAATPAAAYWPYGGYHNGWRHGWSGGYGDFYGQRHRWGGGWREYGDGYNYNYGYGYGYGDRDSYGYDGYGYGDDGDGRRPWRPYHRPVIGSAPPPGPAAPGVAPKALSNGPVPPPPVNAAAAPAAPVVPAGPANGVAAAPAASIVPTAAANVAGGGAAAPVVPAASVDGASADAAALSTSGPIAESKDQAAAADCSAANKPALDASGAQLRSLTVSPCK
jgi:hypothetical protein